MIYFYNDKIFFSNFLKLRFVLWYLGNYNFYVILIFFFKEMIIILIIYIFYV